MANGADRRTRSNHSCASRSATATAATVCWARMSSGLAGIRSDSMRPAVMRSATTAVSTRSPRCLGKNTPRETSPTWWPARPTRCRPEATEGGDSTWITWSTAPMSMPSSSELVATTQRIWPVFSASSTMARCSLDTEPWWARAKSETVPDPVPVCPATWAGPWKPVGSGVRKPGTASGCSAAAAASARASQISLRRPVRRSARRRELANTSVERRSATRSTIRSSTCGQMDPPVTAPSSPSPPVEEPGPRSWAAAGEERSVRSGTGTVTVRSQRLAEAGRTTVTGCVPPRNRATSAAGSTVADRPIRCTGASSRASRRSRETARWAPRLVPATACTSSTITVRTPASAARACEVSMRYSDSGVVMRMSGGSCCRRRRSAAGVSPERTPTRTRGTGLPWCAAVCVMPTSGARRFRSTSTPSAFSGET